MKIFQIDKRHTFFSFGVPPLDLQVVRHTRVYNTRRDVSLLQRNVITSYQVEGLGPFKIKRFLDENVTHKWQIKWNECVKSRVTYG